jgi:hypothetical protein
MKAEGGGMKAETRKNSTVADRRYRRRNPPRQGIFDRKAARNRTWRLFVG